MAGAHTLLPCPSLLSEPLSHSGKYPALLLLLRAEYPFLSVKVLRAAPLDALSHYALPVLRLVLLTR